MIQLSNGNLFLDVIHPLISRGYRNCWGNLTSHKMRRRLMRKDEKCFEDLGSNWLGDEDSNLG
jgi:hypothetical protein